MPKLRHRSARAVALVAAAGLVSGGLFVAAPAPAAPSGKSLGAPRVVSDNQPAPMAIARKREAQRQALRERNLRRVSNGLRPLPRTQDIVLEREGTDKIFVVLAEFGDERFPAPEFQDDAELYDPQPQRFDGPLHNEIPEPDRSVDNSTLWEEDYSQEFYENMYFTRMRKYYERQSSGRYSVEGDVTEWVKVPYNQALYGRDYCGSITCDSTYALIRDALAVWVQDRLDAGQTMDEITDYLETFDHQDRYDADNDGNFAEPDGFIDHFQIVHAGGDEAAGDPIFGSDAIWSHRSYAYVQEGGPHGFPGVNVGSNEGDFSVEQDNPVPDNPTGVWVGDYTIQPENGGLGVFAHEFGHDLDLPDLYETAGNTGYEENSTGFWSIMSSGSNAWDGGSDGSGDNPTDFGVWELFQLGWLDAVTEGPFQKGPYYDVAEAGTRSEHRLSKNVPATDKGVQALFTLLPDNEVRTLELDPTEGTRFWFSGQGDNLDSRLSTVGIDGDALTADVNYQFEYGYDFGFLEATSNGTDWAPVETNLSEGPEGDDYDGNNPTGFGWTGESDGWDQLTATLPADTTGIRFRYKSDPFYNYRGLAVDDVRLDGNRIGGGETTDTGWTTAGGFTSVTGQETELFFNSYVAENRQYDGYDKSLKTGYHFGFGGKKANWLEHYPYQNGMLVSYWNEEFEDNNVGTHPGGGMLLPVDAHPKFFRWKDGTKMRPRIMSFDSTFGLRRTDAFELHRAGQKGTSQVPSQKAVPTFDDTLRYWRANDAGAVEGDPYYAGWYSVDVPKTGTTITVVRQNKAGSLSVKVGKS